MDIQERINRQRVHHIVASYQLDGDDGDAFAELLTQLLETYCQSLIELSLLESIVKGWSEIPMQKGLPFLHGVHDRLRAWQPDLDISSQASTPLNTRNPAFLGVISVDVKASDTPAITPESIGITITPGQFEQITGLDASLVFDGNGHVLLNRPVEMKKPLEPQQ